jgi:hypothetical protein
MADINFKFKEDEEDILGRSFAYKISSMMQEPVLQEWLLSGPSKLERFDAMVIAKGLQCLPPNKFNMYIVSKKFKKRL